LIKDSVGSVGETVHVSLLALGNSSSAMMNTFHGALP
jgi:hypothetical protein